MLPEELAREKIDKQLENAGWDVVSRDEYTDEKAVAVREALMRGNTECDYLLFVDGKAIAVLEAKKESSNLGEKVAQQAEAYSVSLQKWYKPWFPDQVPLVYLANGNKICFKNMLKDPDGDYVELSEMHSPKKMLKEIGGESEYGKLPRIDKEGLGLHDCQYDAEVELEKSLKAGKRKALAVLATGSGKTYLACLAVYRLLNYTSVKRVLFLVDRNNLARQAEAEFSHFDRTEKQQPMSDLYHINRLRKNEDIDGDIIISTIQKLFAVLTGQTITEEDEDKEDELITYKDNEKNNRKVQLGDNLKLPPDYFQFIIVDECHRSIYGKWRTVLDYFKDAKVLGLTATPNEDAEAYFNHNIIKRYTYEESVDDGVNVPSRVYRIITEATVHGGTIEKGEEVTEPSKRSDATEKYAVQNRIDYSPMQLDRSVINLNQIEAVIRAYAEAIYTNLYPDRTESWRYVPKTLIFAKDDNHATQIVNAVRKVFSDKFEDGIVPESFVQKITYSVGNSNALIRDLRNEKDFRIAVTVTLVATGTDVKPLEVVLFMNDVKSDILYTQMKGRGCRYIGEDKLREVTPNAKTKGYFYIVDAVGVTEHDKNIPMSTSRSKRKVLTLEHLLEHLAHGEVSDENLVLLRDYCATINKRYEDSFLFGRHLNQFISSYGFAPKALAHTITKALSDGELPEYINISDSNSARKALIHCLISNVEARKKLLEMQKGYYVFAPDKPDETIYAGFSREEARSFIDTFEQYLKDNADSVEALRIIYNAEDTVITHSMLADLQDKLLAENKEYIPSYIWSKYKAIDTTGCVEELDVKQNKNALTHLIQIARFAFRKNDNLISLFSGYARNFSLYCGQAQRQLDDKQKEIMKQIAEYIIRDGAISVKELNECDTDLWRKAYVDFKGNILSLSAEIEALSRFILKAA